MPPKEHSPVVLFGYDSNPFTNKVPLVLRIKRIPFSYILVPSMLPRPLLTSTFALQYRKIPVLAIGQEIYCDTSLIIEALEHFFHAAQGWGTVYPKFEAVDELTYRGLVRGFASYWTDKPLFRTTTAWAKRWENLASLDLQLSMLEPTFKEGTWAIPTQTPSLADVSLYYQLRGGIDIAAGKGAYDLSGGGVEDSGEDGDIVEVFNENRYPWLWRWFHSFETYTDTLPDFQTTIPKSDMQWKETLRQTPLLSGENLLVPTAVEQRPSLDVRRGLMPGLSVSIAPDDTGRNNPTISTLVKIGIEEVVITPNEKAELDVRVHFPRLGFVAKVVEGSRL